MAVVVAERAASERALRIKTKALQKLLKENGRLQSELRDANERMTSILGRILEKDHEPE